MLGRVLTIRIDNEVVLCSRQSAIQWHFVEDWEPGMRVKVQTACCKGVVCDHLTGEKRGAVVKGRGLAGIVEKVDLRKLEKDVLRPRIGRVVEYNAALGAILVLAWEVVSASMIFGVGRHDGGSYNSVWNLGEWRGLESCDTCTCLQSHLGAHRSPSYLK